MKFLRIRADNSVMMCDLVINYAADDKIRVLIEIYQRCVSKDVNVLEICLLADKCLLLSRKLLVMLEIYQRFVLNLRQSC